MDALDAGFDSTDGAFMMVSAPAGYGKSYLLSQWAEAISDTGVLCIWCGLSEDDRDPVVLWTTIVDALRVSARDACEILRGELECLVPSTDPRRHSEFIAGFTGAISRYALQVVMVFDDAHVLEGSESEGEFVRLLQTAPPNVFVSFATRSPLQTQRSRVAGRLLELTADALSFTPSETMELFDHTFVVDELESGTAIGRFVDAAEGWPAALSLALLSLEANPEKRRPAILFDPSLMHDYLQSEVYLDLNPREREVLLLTAVTPTVTAELVAATTAVGDAGDVLRDLATKNRMLHRVSTDDDDRAWYRVQPLFGRFLHEKLTETDPAKLASLVARTAEWHAEHGDPLEALALASSPPNPELVDRILRRHGYAMVMDRHARQQLLSYSTTDAAISGPFARLMIAHASILAGRPERAGDLIKQAHIVDLGVDDLLEWDWLHYVVRLSLALGTKGPVDSLSSGWPEQTLASVPDDLRLAVQLSRGIAASRSGDPSAAERELTTALTVAENQNDLPRLITSLVGLAGVAVSRFDAHGALSLAQRAIELSARIPADRQGMPQIVAHCLASWASAELLDTTGAREHAAAGAAIDLDEPDEAMGVLVSDTVNASTFETTDQKRRIAQDFVTRWPPAYVDGTSTTLVTMSLHFGLRMSAQLGEFRWSERLLDQARRVMGENYDWQVAYSLYLMSIGREAATRTVLTPLLADESSSRAPLSNIIAWSLEAALEARARNDFRAHAALYRALEHADSTGGYLEATRVGVDELAPILSAGLNRFGAHEHVARALLTLSGARTTPLVGPLTERERQILGELRSLRTVEEIGHDLFLSVNTVKTHMRSIYRKLDATSRRQAIATAEEIGLI